MDSERDFGQTKKGRPRKAGHSVRITIRLREGEPDVDAILERLVKLPVGQRSAYIRRVLAGAPVEALDQALARESDELAADLDAMWAADWDDEE
ncbi:MAG: hypothetical protein JXA93_07760 [Anaerolineae bacterium]|nr:hypothetical protein [Anaerolineae bacterium]